jgi:GT2 family glycosyltransferase
MDLADYLGREDALVDIVRAHQAQAHGYRPALCVPFFCVKVPYVVSASVGDLDEGFGRGGGEDCDYCLRCHLAGCRVLFALEAYVLHFMGKSTWRGAETAEQSRARERAYVRAFREKWGSRLLEVMILRKLDTVRTVDPVWRAWVQGNFKFVIEELSGGLGMAGMPDRAGASRTGAGETLSILPSP